MKLIFLFATISFLGQTQEILTVDRKPEYILNCTADHEGCKRTFTITTFKTFKEFNNTLKSLFANQKLMTILEIIQIEQQYPNICGEETFFSLVVKGHVVGCRPLSERRQIVHTTISEGKISHTPIRLVMIKE